MPIINNLSGNEIEILKLSDFLTGVEYDITDVYFGELQVFTVWAETESALPLTVNANGEPLTDYKLYGNTVQDGTPTPENPIVPSGCGERTWNLLPFDDKNFVISTGGSNLIVECKNGSLNMKGTATEIITTNANWKNNFTFELKAGTYYCNSPSPLGGAFGRYIKKYDDNSNIIGADKYTFTLTENTKCYLSFYIYNKVIDSEIKLMLNLGSTALPYEPYGYKLPLTANGVEHSIYLGEVETTRMIKKLVLTGEENWSAITITTNNAIFRLDLSDYPLSGIVPISTHYTGSTAALWRDVANDEVTTSIRNLNAVAIRHIGLSVADFKAYLAQQYAAGTPVTVWYVLAEPETAVVNEPLMKIGDYADEISGTGLPTLNGITVYDCDLAVKPSKMYVKYRKHGT